MNTIYDITRSLEVLDVGEQESAIIQPIFDNSLVGQFVHLWNNYKQGRKPTSGSWLVERHYLVSKRIGDLLVTNEVVTLHYPYDKEYGVRLTTFLRSQICTENEYLAWEASLNPSRHKANAT